MTSEDYWLENRAETPKRSEWLATLFDEGTFRHLDALGVGPGWRCWEVDAGGPSVPAWLAERVGTTGRVLATDIDDPPVESVDLVHARLVLEHVRDRAEAVRRMVRAVRPGGWVVIEDFDVDFQASSMPDASSDHHYLSNRIRAGFLTLLGERGIDFELGRKLPRLLRDAGLVEVAADGYFPLALRASAFLEAAHIEQVRAGLAGMRLASDEELDGYLDALRRGTLDVATPPLISAWGRVPA
jgi:SAM-dependent methyltransferase